MGLESGWNCHISLLNDANSEEHDSNLESSELRKSSESTGNEFIWNKSKKF